jgi:hypothetical protein
MTQMPLSNTPMGAGMACISPHRGGIDFFFNPQRGDVQAISKLLTFVLEHLKCTDLFSTRSEVGFNK